MKIKRILTLCLAFAMMLCIMAVPASAANETTRFSDVTPDAWYYEAVMALADSGIISGYSDGTFRPDGTITQGELAVMLCRIFGLDTSSPYFREDGTSIVRENKHGSHDDTNVNVGHWAEGAMQQMQVGDTVGEWAMCRADMPLNRGWAIGKLANKIVTATWPDGTRLSSAELSNKAREMVGKIPDIAEGFIIKSDYNTSGWAVNANHTIGVPNTEDLLHYANYRVVTTDPFHPVATGEEVIAHNYLVAASATGGSGNDLTSWNPYAIAEGYAMGLTHGVDSTGRCDPWAPVTRAQVVQMLFNMGINYAGQLTYPDYSGKGGLSYGFGS